MQINPYLYGLGLRYYPFSVGLQLGYDAGFARILLMNSDPYINDLASD
ncbi:hypothetical protein MASR2M78_36400 [Treponema sp.]